MDSSSERLPFQFYHDGAVDIKELQKKAPVPPRYLIRVHSGQSQGLMTDNSFISAAELFATQHDLPSLRLQDYNPKTFERHVHSHLTNHKGTGGQVFQSPFISFTVSLRAALAWAKMCSQRSHPAVKIAVLDTTTIGQTNCDCRLPCQDPFHLNPIWPADLLYRACGGKVRHYPDEFIAFGHARGSFKTCTFAELETTFLNRYLPELARLPKNQYYEALPEKLTALWSMEQPLHKEEKELVIHIAKQLSNDRLLIPMVAFVLCTRRRSVEDVHVLDTVVRAARLVEKKALYDFIGYFDAFPVIDFFSTTRYQQIVTADSDELKQTSEILERVKSRFAEYQEREASMQ